MSNVSVTSNQIIDSINHFTKHASNTQTLATELTPTNAALLAIGTGPWLKIIASTQGIVTTGLVSSSWMQSVKPFAAGTESDAIFEAYQQSATAQVAALNALAEKGNYCAPKVPMIKAPMIASLKHVESTIDSFAISLVNTVPSHAEELQRLANNISTAMNSAMQSFSDKN